MMPAVYKKPDLDIIAGIYCMIEVLCIAGCKQMQMEMNSQEVWCHGSSHMI